MMIIMNQNYPLKKVNATHLYEIVTVSLYTVYQFVTYLYWFW